MSSINSSDYKNRTDMAEQYQAYQDRKEKVRQENEKEIENLKANYNSQKADLEDRFEQSIQAEKLSQYDHLKNLKSQTSREIRDIENRGKQSLREKESSYHREQSHVDIEAKAKIDETKQKLAAMEKYEYERAREAENQIKHDHRRNADLILKDSDKQLKTMVDQKENFLYDQKKNHSVALDQIQEHYQGAKTALQNQYNTELKTQAHTLSEDLNARKIASATAIDTFETKNQDPFYNIKQFDAEITENGSEYSLRVKVPEYERGQFRVQIAGQTLQLVGNRTTDQSAEIAHGNTIATRTYQTVSERYNLDYPVDARAITWVADGDWVEYTIPKLGPERKANEALRAREIAKADADVGRELSFIESLPKPTAALAGKGKSTLG